MLGGGGNVNINDDLTYEDLGIKEDNEEYIYDDDEGFEDISQMDSEKQQQVIDFTQVVKNDDNDESPDTQHQDIEAAIIGEEQVRLGTETSRQTSPKHASTE